MFLHHIQQLIMIIGKLNNMIISNVYKYFFLNRFLHEPKDRVWSWGPVSFYYQLL
jgi:hypothetical protein